MKTNAKSKTSDGHLSEFEALDERELLATTGGVFAVAGQSPFPSYVPWKWPNGNVLDEMGATMDRLNRQAGVA